MSNRVHQRPHFFYLVRPAWLGCPRVSTCQAHPNVSLIQRRYAVPLPPGPRLIMFIPAVLIIQQCCSPFRAQTRPNQDTRASPGSQEYGVSHP